MTKILLVEDHLETADALTIWLESAGYTVIVAYDANQAMALIASQKPDLVITDCKLPGPSGIDLIKWTRGPLSPLRHLPIIALTAYYSEFADQGLNAGADRMFSKPTDAHVILANIRNLLDPGNLPIQN